MPLLTLNLNLRYYNDKFVSDLTLHHYPGQDHLYPQLLSHCPEWPLTALVQATCVLLSRLGHDGTWRSQPSDSHCVGREKEEREREEGDRRERERERWRWQWGGAEGEHSYLHTGTRLEALHAECTVKVVAEKGKPLFVRVKPMLASFKRRFKP